jgi:ribosomal protein S18 acetylase RimI-like enzyme
LVLVRAPPEQRAARSLLREYRDWLAADRTVTAFDDRILAQGLTKMDEEISMLPGAFGPPTGAFVLAKVGPDWVGCGGLRRLDASTGEIKRLYVRPAHRGGGVGRALVLELLRHARKGRCQRVVLDTLPRMVGAIALYRRMGFRPIPPYWDHPVAGALFFELSLEDPSSPADSRFR